MANELITNFGYEKILKEFKYLYETVKPYWVKEKQIAAQHGDRSENAEYISAKEEIRNTDKRLRFLNRIINNSDVIDISKIPHTKVNFGSKITLLDFSTNKEKTFKIVGTHETNPSENKISNKSPLGRLLLGKEINEEFEFRINDNISEYEILKIQECKMEEL